MELPKQPIQWAALLLMGAAYSTMVLGAFVKAIGAGMACPEWPTCQGGNPLPALSYAGVTAEIFHRIAATLVVLAGLVLLFLEFTKFREERGLIKITLVAAALVGIQIALGALTITSNLQPVVVTAHLATATLIFGVTIVIAQRVWKLPRPIPGQAAAARAPTDGAKSG
jgi:heme a synthase